MALRHVATIAIRDGAIQTRTWVTEDPTDLTEKAEKGVELVHTRPTYKRDATAILRTLLLASGIDEFELPSLRRTPWGAGEEVLGLLMVNLLSYREEVERAKENLKLVRSMGMLQRLQRLGGAESKLREAEYRLGDEEEYVAKMEAELSADKLLASTLRRLAQRQEELPVLIADELGGGEWLYRGEVYSANQPYTPDQVKLLVWEKKERERTKLERLKRQMEAGGATGEARRERIPEDVRTFVWRRDGGQCVRCGRTENLEFDHIIPVSKGGSNTAKNVQLLCAECNRKKSDHI